MLAYWRFSPSSPNGLIISKTREPRVSAKSLSVAARSEELIGLPKRKIVTPLMHCLYCNFQDIEELNNLFHDLRSLHPSQNL